MSGGHGALAFREGHMTNPARLPTTWRLYQPGQKIICPGMRKEERRKHPREGYERRVDARPCQATIWHVGRLEVIYFRVVGDRDRPMPHDVENGTHRCRCGLIVEMVSIRSVPWAS